MLSNPVVKEDARTRAFTYRLPSRTRAAYFIPLGVTEIT